MHGALSGDVPFPVFLDFALVVSVLAFGECYLAFDDVAFPVHARAYASVALLLDAAEDARELLLVEQ